MPIANRTIQQIDRGVDRNLAELENKVKRALTIFYKKKIEPLSLVLPADSIRKRYEAQVSAMIHNMVEESYKTGTALVGREIKKKVPEFTLFTSKTDFNNIETQTNQLANDFWSSISRLVTRKNDFILNPEGNQLEPKPEFDAVATMAERANNIVFAMFNLAIFSKMGIIGSVNTQAAATSRPTPAAPITPPPAPTAEEPPITADNIDPTHIIEIRELKEELMFLTKEDLKVDTQICAPLNRTVYSRDEPDLPLPPLHKNCRCTMIPLV